MLSQTRYSSPLRTRQETAAGAWNLAGGAFGTGRSTSNLRCDIERGIRNLSLVNIEKLATALDISISALFIDYEVD